MLLCKFCIVLQNPPNPLVSRFPSLISYKVQVALYKTVPGVYFNCPSISNWIVLIIGITSFMCCLTGLCLCVFLLTTSPFNHYLLCSEKVLNQVTFMKHRDTNTHTTPTTQDIL